VTARVVLAAVLAGVVLLVAAQLILPGIAARRIRDRVDPYGHVRSVQVGALPAIEMLWGQMDSLNVKTGPLRMPVAETANLLSGARGINDLNLASSQADLTSLGLTGSGLLLREVTLRKRGAQLEGQATLLESDLRAALPAGFDIQPVGSGGGAVQVRASGALFGAQASIEGVVGALDGKLVVQPTGIPFGSLATLTLFSDPRIFIQGVAATPHSDGYRLVIQARAV
jgi:DUF2993 family protein